MQHAAGALLALWPGRSHDERSAADPAHRLHPDIGQPARQAMAVLTCGRAAAWMRAAGRGGHEPVTAGPPGVVAVRGVPWWGVISSAVAPVLLVAGWTVAAVLQPRPYEAMAGTVSALAAVGAADRWVMTLVFAVVGSCEVVTGLALRPAASPGRLILIVGGLAGVLVAMNPEHAGGSLIHACWAVAGFSALVAWPAGAWQRGPSVPWGLRRAVSAGAAGILLGLAAWFGAELIAAGSQVGLAERVLGTAQAAWPLAVILSCRLSRAAARAAALAGTGRAAVP
jgi:Protein of unknown function (DUF998)